MHRVYIIALMLLMSIGCGAPHRLTISETQKDSISVVVKESVVYKDTIIYVQIPVEVEREVLADTDTSHLETSVAVSDAWVIDGRLNHTLSNKKDASLAADAKIPEYHNDKETIKVVEKVVKEVVEVEVEKRLNSWQTFRMVLGSITLVILAIFLLWKIIRKYILR